MGHYHLALANFFSSSHNSRLLWHRTRKKIGGLLVFYILSKQRGLSKTIGLSTLKEGGSVYQRGQNNLYTLVGSTSSSNAALNYSCNL